MRRLLLLLLLVWQAGTARSQPLLLGEAALEPLPGARWMLPRPAGLTAVAGSPYPGVGLGELELALGLGPWELAVHAASLEAASYERRVLGVALAWTAGDLRLRTRLHLRDERVEGLVQRRRGGWEISLAARLGPLVVGLWQEEDLPGDGVPRPSVADLVLLLPHRWWDLALGRRDARWREEGVWRAGLRLRAAPALTLSVRGGVEDWALVLGLRGGSVAVDLGLPLASDDPTGPVVSLHWPASPAEAPWNAGSSPR